MEEQQIKEKIPFWNKLTEEQASKIAESAHIEHFKKGETINRSAEQCKGMIRINKGQVRTYFLSEEGREVTLYRLLSGDVCVLSASCLLDAVAFDVIIEAVEDTEVLVVPSQVLHAVIEENVYVELFFAKTANERFSDVMWMMQQILFMRADQRVAIFLWDELTRSEKCELSYTHEQIANLIGTAREVVTRILKYFAKEEIVKLSRGKIEILDKEKLKKYL